MIIILYKLIEVTHNIEKAIIEQAANLIFVIQPIFKAIKDFLFLSMFRDWRGLYHIFF
jgi:hypothetical protein